MYRKCIECGKEFWCIDNEYNKATDSFCNVRCQIAAGKAWMQTCKHCQTEFICKDKRQKYCCAGHRIAHERGKKFLGNEVSRYDSLKEKYGIESSCEYRKKKAKNLDKETI